MTDITNGEYLGSAADDLRSQLYSDHLSTEEINDLNLRMAACVLAENSERIADSMSRMADLLDELAEVER